jgi:hypothetical protein
MLLNCHGVQGRSSQAAADPEIAWSQDIVLSFDINPIRAVADDSLG